MARQKRRGEAGRIGHRPPRLTRAELCVYSLHKCDSSWRYSLDKCAYTSDYSFGKCGDAS